MHNGFAQAEGVADLAGVPATGCLLNMGFPRFGGGVGGYARYVAICPRRLCSSTPRRWHWDPALGMRVR
jgi:hypothetical protein